MDEEEAEVVEQLDYFRTLVSNNDNKIEFLYMFIDTLQPDDWERIDELHNAIGRIYDENWEYQSQVDELDGHLSNLNFERFIVEQQWQMEDEAAFQAEAERAQAQADEYEMEWAELNA
jgi:hypothetical protein